MDERVLREYPDPHWADYLVLGVFLSICLGIGIYFSRKKSSGLEMYLLGNRQLRMIPVALSLFVTFASAISLMGFPSEIYVYGTMILYTFLGVIMAMIVMGFMIVPLVFPLKLTSSYEYLERRFNSKAIRYLGAAIGILQTVCYMGVTLYAPALALQTVARIPLWLSIVVIGGIGTIYTSIGGIRSVVWTDVFQFLMIFIGLGSIAIKGCIAIGDMKALWEIPEVHGRIDLKTLDIDPRVRHTVWGLVLGTSFTWIGNFCNQSSIQRIVCVRTMKEAKRCFQLNIIFNLCYAVFLGFVGFVMYTYYNITNCDPLKAGFITDMNQLTPFFVFDVLRHLPGLPGIFISCLFSGTLSTISSGINALATNTLKDILDPWLTKFPSISPTLVAKLLALLYGVISIGLAYLMQFSPGPVVQMAVSFFGACGGPLGGLFFLGGLFPNTNFIGAFVGGSLALIFNFWIGIGSRFYGRKPIKLPPNNISGCFIQTQKEMINNSIDTSLSTAFTSISTISAETTNGIFTSTFPLESDLYEDTFTDYLYNISYVWYGLIGFVMTIVIGLLVSCCTGFDRGHPVPNHYIIPCCRKFWGLKTETELMNLTYTATRISKRTHTKQTQQAEVETPPPYFHHTRYSALSEDNF